jgi:hypothetical protein
MTINSAATSTKLSDTRLVLLSQAAQHPERAVAIPERLRGGALARVVGPLMANRVVEVVPHRGDLPVYKTEADGSRTALLITNAGLLALGIEPEPATEKAPDAEVTELGPLPSAGEEMCARSRQLRTGTKQEMLIGMLRRPEGATVPEVVEATSWLPHTVRGAIAGALKKKLGLQISSEKIEGRGRVYRIRG